MVQAEVVTVCCKCHVQGIIAYPALHKGGQTASGNEKSTRRTWTNAHRSTHQAKSNISDPLTMACAALVHACTAATRRVFAPPTLRLPL